MKREPTKDARINAAIRLAGRLEAEARSLIMREPHGDPAQFLQIIVFILAAMVYVENAREPTEDDFKSGAARFFALAKLLEREGFS